MGKGRLTPQSEKFCELMAENKKNKYECYIEAYPKAKNWAKASVSAAASALLKKPHIQKKINHLKSKTEEKLVESYAWDKQKSTQVLMKALQKIEGNLDTLSEVRDTLIDNSTGAEDKLKAVSKTLTQMNFSVKALKELASELNIMYGFNKSNVSIDGALAQVVFEGEADLPPDEENVDNDGNEIGGEEYEEDR